MEDASDPTEAQREDIRHDSVVYNNSSVNDLKIVAQTILRDIRSDSLK